MTKIQSNMYVAYDGRARGGDTDDAAVLEAWAGEDYDNEQQIISDCQNSWSGCDWVLVRCVKNGSCYSDDETIADSLMDRHSHE